MQWDDDSRGDDLFPASGAYVDHREHARTRAEGQALKTRQRPMREGEILKHSQSPSELSWPTLGDFALQGEPAMLPRSTWQT